MCYAPASYFLSIKVWNQNGRNPYITYEYTVMRDPLTPVSQPPIYTGSDGGFSHQVSVEVSNVSPHNESVNGKVVPEMQGKQVRMQNPGPDKPAEETNEVYEDTAAVDCDQNAPTPPYYPGRIEV